MVSGQKSTYHLIDLRSVLVFSFDGLLIICQHLYICFRGKPIIMKQDWPPIREKVEPGCQYECLIPTLTRIIGWTGDSHLVISWLIEATPSPGPVFPIAWWPFPGPAQRPKVIWRKEKGQPTALYFPGILSVGGQSTGCSPLLDLQKRKLRSERWSPLSRPHSLLLVELRLESSSPHSQINILCTNHECKCHLLPNVH